MQQATKGNEGPTIMANHKCIWRREERKATNKWKGEDNGALKMECVKVLVEGACKDKIFEGWKI